MKSLLKKDICMHVSRNVKDKLSGTRVIMIVIEKHSLRYLFSDGQDKIILLSGNTV